MNIEYATVPVGKLKIFPGNPRKGNVNAIADSLTRNGQFQPIVAQKSTGFVLSGNHTLLAAKSLRWPTIEVAWVDVNDDQAKRIVLAANRTSDLATYDHDALTRLLESVQGDAVGTGYTDSEIDLIVQAAQEATQSVKLPSMTQQAVMEQVNEAKLDAVIEGDYTPLGDDLPARPVPPAPPEPDFLKEAAPTLGGIVQLTDDIEFDGLTQWDIPRLRDDMLCDSVPEPLVTWAGSATRNWAIEDQWWLYNFGIDSMSGMKDPSKAILAFYCWDKYFENFWWYPARNVSKVLNSGIQYALTPNWGQSNCPKVIAMYNLYRARWMGRYFQEAGIKLIPDIEWRSGDKQWLREMVLGTLPDNVPVISLQGQNVGAGIEEDEYLDDVKEILDTIDPHTLLLYAGPPGLRQIQSLNPKCRIIHLEPRINALHRLYKEKQGKETL